MSIFSKPFGSAIAVAALVALPLSSSFAQMQQPHPNIAVPAPGPGQPSPQPAGFAGCYTINQDLYGPYRMSFCLTRYGGGNYRVTGGGLFCNGQVSWNDWGNQARVTIHASYCGQRVNWSADTMVCAPMQTSWHQPQPGQWNQPNARIAVPAPQPSAGNLRCSYYPGVRGFQPVSVIAERSWY